MDDNESNKTLSNTDFKYINNFNEEQTKKICFKLNSNVHQDAANLIKKTFSNPDDYLKIDNNLIFGKVINKIDYNNLSAMKPYKLIGNKENLIPGYNKSPLKSGSERRSFYKNNLLISANSLRTNRFMSSLNNFNSFKFLTSKNGINDKEESNLVRISDEQLVNLYRDRKIKTADPNQKKLLNREIYNNVDSKCSSEMKKILAKQENILIKKEKIEKESNNLAKFVAKKSQRNEKELLMNKTDGFRIKNKCIEKINSREENKPFYFGDFNHWRFSLRKTPGKENKKKLISDKNKIIKKEYFTTYLYNKENNHVDDLGASVNPCLIRGNDENIIKPNSACLKDFKKYASSRVITSKLRKMNINSDEFLSGNNLDVIFFF